MDQGWKRLPLLAIFLLFWRSADGFNHGDYYNVHNRWGPPSDKFSIRAAQSSMSEAHVTGTSPVEEVGSSLFPNRPLERGSKFNLYQFVKGGPSISQSASHAQTAPSSSVSASLPLPVDGQPSSSLTSSGSTLQGAASGPSLQTQYAASGSGPVVSSQGEGSSYPAKLVSGQSTSDSLLVSSSQETSVRQSAEASMPVLSQSISYSSSSAPGATSVSQSSPVLLESSGQHVSSQGEGSHSVLSQGSLLAEAAGLGPLDLSKSPETSNQLLPMPLVVSSQSTNGQSSPSLLMVSPQSSSDSKSTGSATNLYTQGSVLSSQAQGSVTSQGSSGVELSASSVQSIPTQVGSGSYGGVSQTLGASSLYTPGSLVSNKLDTLPLGVSSQSTSAQSSPSVSPSTQRRSGTQLATSSHYVPVQGGSSSSLYLKRPGTLDQYAPASPTKYVSTPMSSPQAIYSQTTNRGSSYRAVSEVGSLSQTGASGQFTSQGGNYFSGLLPQSQATSSQYAPGYSKPISSPQSPFSQSASVLSSRKQYTSASQGSSGAQFGASTGFASQGISSSYSGPVQSQASSLLCKCALSPQGVDSQSITDRSSRKQFTSTFGTQSGSSTPFTLQGSITYDGSPQPQGTASQFAPVSQSYPSVLSPSQDVASQSTIPVSRKQLASTYTGSSGTQAGSSPPFTLHGSTAYGGSPRPQDTAGQFAPGPQSSYASVPLSSPQADPSTTAQGSQKQPTSTFTGSSGTQAGSSTLFTLQRSTAVDRLPQPQDATSRFAAGSSSPYMSVSLSSPQGVASQSSSQKQFTSASQGSSGALFGASTGLPSQGMRRFYSSSVQSKGTTSQTALGSSTPYASASHSSPQAGPSTTALASRKQLTSTYMGSSGTQAGSSTFTLQGSAAYGGSHQPQDTAGQFAPGSQSSYASASLYSPQAVAGPSTVQSSRKQFTSIYRGSSGAQFGPSTGSAPESMSSHSRSVQSQATASQSAPGSKSSYASTSLSSPQAGPSTTALASRKQLTSTYMGSSGTQAGSSNRFTLQGSTAYGGLPQPQDTAGKFDPGSQSSYASVLLSSPQAVAGPTTVQSSRKQFTSTFTGSSGTQAGSSNRFTLQGSTAYGGSSLPQDAANQFVPASSSPYTSVSLSSPQGVASQSSQAHQGYSVSQSQQSQRWQPSATRWTQGIQTSDAAASLGSSSSQSSPMQFSSLSSTGGSSSRVSGQFVSAQGGSTSYGGSFQPQSLPTKYIPGSQLLPHDPSVVGQGKFGASEVLSSYSSVNNQNAPAQPSRSSSSSHFYSVKG